MFQQITSGAIRVEVIRYAKKGKSTLANLACSGISHMGAWGWGGVASWCAPAEARRVSR